MPNHQVEKHPLTMIPHCMALQVWLMDIQALTDGSNPIDRGRNESLRL